MLVKSVSLVKTNDTDFFRKGEDMFKRVAPYIGKYKKSDLQIGSLDSDYKKICSKDFDI